MEPHLKCRRLAPGVLRSPRYLTATASIAWVLTVAALLALPTTAASGGAVVSISAPYTGAVHYDHVTQDLRTGCNSRDRAPLGTFNATTGGIVFGAWVFSKKCNGFGGSQEVIGLVGATDIGFTVASSGSYNLTARWIIDANLTTLVSGSGTTSWASFRPNLCVHDSTTTVTVCRAGAQFGAYNSSSNRSVNDVANDTQIVRSAKLTAGDSYFFRVFLTIDLFAGVNNASANHSSARLTLGLGGPRYPAELVSLRVI